MGPSADRVEVPWVVALAKDGMRKGEVGAAMRSGLKLWITDRISNTISRLIDAGALGPWPVSLAMGPTRVQLGHL